MEQRRAIRAAVLALAAVAIGVPGLVAAGSEEDETAYLGVLLREETGLERGGARVTRVMDGSPAEAAGIREDDVIVGFGDRVVRGPAGLTEALHARRPGEAVSVTVVRDGREDTLQVKLGSRADLAPGFAPPTWVPAPEGESPYDPEAWKEWQQELQRNLQDHGRRLQERQYRFAPNVFWGRPKLGVQLVETTPELREHLGGSEDAGVLVSKVLSGTPAARAGIEVGDLIVSIAGEEVSTSSELVDALRDRDGQAFDVEVVRGGRRLTLAVELPEPEELTIPSGPRAALPTPAPPAPPALTAAPSVPAARCTPAPPAPPALTAAPSVPAARSTPAPPAPPAPPARTAPPPPPVPHAPVESKALV
jgi:predicted metalloprotease with PDZ domain